MRPKSNHLFNSCNSNRSAGRPVSDAAGLGEIVPKPRHSAEQIGKRVAELRKKLDMNQSDLAKAIGMAGGSSIGNIETGSSIKQYVQLADIAFILKVTPNQLLGFDPLPLDEQGDQLEIMGAAILRMLINDYQWPREQAEALVGIAREVAIEKSNLDLDRRLEEVFRRRALRPRPLP